MPTISTNTVANTTLRYLNKNSEAQGSYLAQLSSGSRIVSASDDAAGLAVSLKISGDISILEQAATNVQQGQAVLKTVDGALASLSDVLERMKSLAGQSQSGIITDADRTLIDTEYQQLLTEYQSIVDNTKFNGVTLLDGSYNQSFLVGTASTDTIAVTVSDVSSDQFDDGGGTPVTLDNTAVGTAANAAIALDAIDDAITGIATARASVGAFISRFEFRGDVIAATQENLTAANSSIKDADIAEVQTKYTNATTLTDAAIAALGKANQLPEKLLDLLR